MIKQLTHIIISPLVTIIWVIVLALVLRWSVVEIYRIPLSDMLPTILPHDYITINKMAYGLRLPFSSPYTIQWSHPARGDVIVFRTPFDSKYLSIRRVIGLPGDHILVKNDIVYLNEKQILHTIPNRRAKDFSWIKDEAFSNEGITENKNHYGHWEEHLSGRAHSILLKKNKSRGLVFGPYHIPPGYYFVMGDHRDRSQDSRTWPVQKSGDNEKYTNLVSESDILGRANRILISCQQTIPVLDFLCHPKFIRWNRIFLSIYYQ